MRLILFLLITLFCSTAVLAQSPQEQLSFYADVLLHARESDHREMANKEFKKLLKDALKKDSLFRDSLPINSIPVLYTPDSSFRIVTWQLYGEKSSDLFGFIQKRSSTNLIELEDKSEYLMQQEFGVLYPDRWLGAVYTDIYALPGQDSVFLLRGINPVDQYSTLHVLELLVLDSTGIEFGKPIFQNNKEERVHRRIYEVASGANFQLEISEGLHRIISDHLTAVPYNRDSDVMVNVPDGTYEVLDWENGQWIFKERLFERKFQELPLEEAPTKSDQRDIFGRKNKNGG
jgi:hypothetical protein